MSLTQKRFLMLQGPHGPFFAELGAQLRADGAEVWRVGLNGGDQAAWRGPGYLPVQGSGTARDAEILALIERHQISDLLLYGDKRAVHAQALAAARCRGIRTHILEEGYLRPHWITYERQGSNQRSPAARWPIAGLSDAPPCDAPHPAAQWGAMRPHIAYSARYHLWLLAQAHRYPGYRSHRGRSVAWETAEALGSGLGLPIAISWRGWSQRRVLARKAPLFVLLMQLEHDSALADCPEVGSHDLLLRRVLASFARHAAADATLVVKLHPLETRRFATARKVQRVAREFGIARRVTTLPGGQLAPLLDQACAAITVNSTAGQQVLWRGLPLFAFGPCVYQHPELLPEPDLDRFLAAPRSCDPQIYARFRAFLFRTSQLPGSFYAPAGRAEAIAALRPRLVENRDFYDLEASVSRPKSNADLIRAAASGQVALR